MTVLDQLRSEIVNQQALAIVGAGVSINATGGSAVASWRGLLKNGVARCLERRPPPDPLWETRVLAQIDGDMIDLLCAAENVSQRLGAPDDGEYAGWLEDTIGALRTSDTTVVSALARLKMPLATTNYDDVIENATGLREATWQDRRKVESFARGRADYVLHLHGHWMQPESIVLGIRSYENILRDDHAQNMLRTLLTVKTLVFVGFGSGLSDPNFGALLRWAGKVFRSSVFPSYHLCLDSERTSVELEHAGQRILAVPYGPKHSDLCTFLKALV